jgi:hypothetical protein
MLFNISILANTVPLDPGVMATEVRTPQIIFARRLRQRRPFRFRVTDNDNERPLRKNAGLTTNLH